MTAALLTLEALADLRLSVGSHDDRARGVCLLEAAAWLAGEDHSDEPACVSPLLGKYGRTLNDRLVGRRPDLEPRIRALTPKLLGTANRPDIDQRAGLMAADWLFRVRLPTWLRLAGLTAEADALANGAELTTWAGVPRAAVFAARDKARSERAARLAKLRAADAAAAADADAAAADAAAAAAYAAAAAAYAAAAADAAADAAAAAYAAAAAAADAAAAAYAAAAADAAAYAAAAADAAAYAAAYAADAAARRARYARAKMAADEHLAPTVAALQDGAVELFERMIALYAPVPA